MQDDQYVDAQGGQKIACLLYKVTFLQRNVVIKACMCNHIPCIRDISVTLDI